MPLLPAFRPTDGKRNALLSCLSASPVHSLPSLRTQPLLSFSSLALFFCLASRPLPDFVELLMACSKINEASSAYSLWDGKKRERAAENRTERALDCLISQPPSFPFFQLTEFNPHRGDSWPLLYRATCCIVMCSAMAQRACSLPISHTSCYSALFHIVRLVIFKTN